jgi:Asp-tRNA(Asn)/Glu-tRNA(Gln) amidotransferase C subunit
MATQWFSSEVRGEVEDELDEFVQVVHSFVQYVEKVSQASEKESLPVLRKPRDFPLLIDWDLIASIKEQVDQLPTNNEQEMARKELLSKKLREGIYIPLSKLKCASLGINFSGIKSLMAPLVRD